MLREMMSPKVLKSWWRRKRPMVCATMVRAYPELKQPSVRDLLGRDERFSGKRRQRVAGLREEKHSRRKLRKYSYPIKQC